MEFIVDGNKMNLDDIEAILIMEFTNDKIISDFANTKEGDSYELDGNTISIEGEDEKIYIEHCSKKELVLSGKAGGTEMKMTLQREK